MSRPMPAPERGASPGRRSIGLFVLAGGLAVSSLAGPLAADLVDYPLTETLRNQTIGLDAVTLVVVAPLAIAAGLLARRGHPLSPVLATVVGAYTAYMYLQFVIGPDYLHYPGTLALHLGLFVLGWVTAARGWTVLARAPLPALTSAARARHSAALFAMAAFVLLRYLPAVPASVAGESIPEESLGDPAMFWSIFLMDLGIFVPLVVVAAVGLRRGMAWAQPGLYAAVGWFVLVTVAVLAMSIVMVVNDDPSGGDAQVALFATTAAVVVGYAARLFAPVLAVGPAGDRVPDADHSAAPQRSMQELRA